MFVKRTWQSEKGKIFSKGVLNNICPVQTQTEIWSTGALRYITWCKLWYQYYISAKPIIILSIGKENGSPPFEKTVKREN